MYGNGMQALVPSYLESAMDQFRANQSKLRKTIEESLGSNPVVQLAQRNMDMFKSAASALRGGKGKGDGKGEGKDRAEGKAEAEGEGEKKPEKDEIAALRAEMAELQKRLDALSQA